MYRGISRQILQYVCLGEGLQLCCCYLLLAEECEHGLVHYLCRYRHWHLLAMIGEFPLLWGSTKMPNFKWFGLILGMWEWENTHRHEKGVWKKTGIWDFADSWNMSFCCLCMCTHQHQCPAVTDVEVPSCAWTRMPMVFFQLRIWALKAAKQKGNVWRVTSEGQKVVPWTSCSWLELMSSFREMAGLMTGPSTVGFLDMLFGMGEATILNLANKSEYIGISLPTGILLSIL